MAIPRGGEGLIRRVAAEAKMPVIKHFTGNCHVYVDRAADLEMAERITVNAKCQRLGVCNAAESLLVHAAVADEFLPRIGNDAWPSAASKSAATSGLRRSFAAAKRGDRRGLRRRVPRADHLVQGGRFAGRGDRAHQPATARSTPTRS